MSLLKTRHFTFSFFAFTLALPCFAQSAEPTKQDYETVNKKLSENNEPLTHPADQKALELLSTELGKEIFKRALQLEVANTAFAKERFPTELALLNPSRNGYMNVENVGSTMLGAGVTSGIAGGFSLSDTRSSRKLFTMLKIPEAQFRRVGDLSGARLLAAGTVASFTGASVKFGIQNNDAETYQELKYAFQEELNLDDYASYWSQILADSESKSRHLYYKILEAIEQEVEARIQKMPSDGSLPINLSDININILGIFKKHEIISAEKSDALERLIESIQRNTPALTKPVSSQNRSTLTVPFVRAQIDVLESTIADIRTRREYFSDAGIHQEILDEADARMAELRRVLEAVSPEDKK